VAKNAWLAARIPGYFELNTEARWRELMGQCAPLFVLNGLRHQHEIQSFCEERLRPSDGSRMSLDNCLAYFEQFYFLLTTDNELYRLNNQEKENLKRVVLSGVGACEPGKQQRFEQALMLYRRDQNWIKCQLSNYRYNLILRLQEQYNTAHLVSGAYSPHTLKLMIQLAEQRQFGLKSESSLHDDYMYFESINRIKQYFKTHYPAIISEFEQTVLDNLSHNLMIDLQAFLTLNGIDTSTWDAQGIVIPYTQLDEFNGFFEDKSFDTVIDFLRDETEEDDTVLRLKQKSAFQQGVRELMTQKLLDDAYAVSVFDVGIVPTFVPGVRLKPGVRFEQLRAVNRALADRTLGFESRYARALLEHPAVVAAYPDFMMTKLEHLLPVVPQLLTELSFDAPTLNTLRAKLILLLSAAYEEGADEQIALLSDALFSVMPDAFPAELLQNSAFAIQLVQHDGLWLEHLRTFQDNQDVVWSSIGQNGWALRYAALSFRTNSEFIQAAQASLNRLFGCRFECDGETINDYDGFISTLYHHLRSQISDSLLPHFVRGVSHTPDFSEMKKMHACALLLHPSRVRATTVFDAAQRLTPQEILRVARERQQLSLLPLPYCEDLARLEAFSQRDQTTTISNWYQAFVREQHSDRVGFEHMADCFQAVQLMLDALIDCVVSGIVAAASAAVVIGVLLTGIIGSVFLYIFTCLVWLNPVMDYLAVCINPVLGALAAIAIQVMVYVTFVCWCILVDEAFKYALTPIAEYSLENTEHFFVALDRLRETTTSFFSQLYTTCFTARDALPEDALVTRCEKSIDRLLFVLKDGSAHQKGAVLNQIWDKIQQEGRVEGSEIDLQARLARPYEVVYQGHSRSLSFFDAAAIKRTPSEPFELDAPQSCFRFFSAMPSTTSAGLGALAVSPML
jgi:hypothetical protein